MRSDTRQAAVLAAGSVVNGLLTYVFFAISTRALGAMAAAPISVLWAYWGFAAAALTFPLQHWVARSVAAYGGEGQIRAGLVRIISATVGLCIVTGSASWLLGDAMFRTDPAAFAALVAAVTGGSAFIGLVRGALTARQQFTQLAIAVAGEGTIRCAGSAVLLAIGNTDPVAYGVVLFAGQLVGLAWPRSVRFGAGVQRTPRSRPAGFLGASASGQLAGQTILVGGPVLLTFLGGSPADVTALFAGLALFRAPYTLAIGVLPRLTGRLTALVVDGRRQTLGRMHRTVVVVTAVLLPPAAAVGAFIGPPVIRWVFGASVQLGMLPTSLVSLGSVLAMSNLVATVTVLAHGRAVALIRAWGAGALAAVAAVSAVRVLAVPSIAAPTASLLATCIAFAVAEAVAFGLLIIEGVRASRAIVPGPGHDAG